MGPPEGRGQVFNGPELLKEDTSDTEPYSHVYIISHCFRWRVINMKSNVMQLTLSMIYVIQSSSF